MNQPSAYSIIVTYNGRRWIGRCLDSLAKSSYNTHIIVIDNSSKDETCSFVKQNYPNVQLIESEKNLGFGRGNNIGLRLAIENNIDYVFLLNQDAYVEPDTIARLIEAQQKNREYGILSPIHLNGKGNDFDEDFYFFLIRSDLKALISSGLFNSKKESTIIDTSFVNAAAWLISKDCVKNTGGFDTIFFHYGEDDNYAQRALFKGFKIGILISTKIYHDKETSFTKGLVPPGLDFKKDSLIFLNQACDLHQQNFKTLIAKRFLRYSFLTMTNLFLLKKKNINYNFLMAKNIALSFSAIKKSRRVSANNDTPYLNINKASSHSIEQ